MMTHSFDDYTKCELFLSLYVQSFCVGWIALEFQPKKKRTEFVQCMFIFWLWGSCSFQYYAHKKNKWISRWVQNSKLIILIDKTKWWNLLDKN